MKIQSAIFTLMFTLLSFNTSVFAIGGLGLQLGQAKGSVSEKLDASKGSAVLATAAFSDPLTLGAYFYIDAIPFFDLEADIAIKGQKYEFQFLNDLGDIGPYEFGWGSVSTYLTLRKSLTELSIPLLAKTKLFYGGGYNMHKVTPLMTVDLMESAMGGSIETNPSGLSEDDLVKFLEDNIIDASGFHIQAGLQFKLLMLDTFLIYRYTLAKDVIPDNDSFGSLNLRLGFGL